MANALIPELNGRRLTVDVLLQNPSRIRDRIAKIADPLLVLDRFFTGLGTPLQGGGLLYSVIKASDYYTKGEAEKRTPGTEYRVVGGVDIEPKLATVEDFGAKAQVLDEERKRNDVSKVDLLTTQIANELTRKLNDFALVAVEAALADGSNTFVGNNWNTVVTSGPENLLTANADRPAADFAEAQHAADVQELGIVYDTLIVHPDQAKALKVAYGSDLKDVLDSNGIEELFSCPRITPATAYMVQKGQVGTVGFEEPLNIEVIPDRATRSTWLQGFCAPSFGVERPFAAKKIVGLAG